MTFKRFACVGGMILLRRRMPSCKGAEIANHSHLHVAGDRMLPSLIIAFREAMEAGLIVGVVLAATK